MNYGKIIYCDTANGIGCRTVLFVSGCTHHCKGCFNDMAWPFNYGKEYTKETENKILESLKPDYIKGLSILGGEPMEPENQAEEQQDAEAECGAEPEADEPETKADDTAEEAAQEDEQQTAEQEQGEQA